MLEALFENVVSVVRIERFWADLRAYYIIRQKIFIRSYFDFLLYFFKFMLVASFENNKCLRAVNAISWY